MQSKVLCLRPLFESLYKSLAGLFFLEGVRSCFAADAEHKDALSAVWTVGQVWKLGGKWDLYEYTYTYADTHTHIH